MTNKQGRLFPSYPHAPYQAHSAPSREAAQEIRPHVGKLHQKVLDALLDAPDGMTDDELLLALPECSPNTVRPRRIELAQRGLVKDSGKTRKTRTGRAATVWVAIPNDMQ